jgi:hypothetical protein
MALSVFKSVFSLNHRDNEGTKARNSHGMGDSKTPHELSIRRFAFAMPDGVRQSVGGRRERMYGGIPRRESDLISEHRLNIRSSSSQKFETASIEQINSKRTRVCQRIRHHHFFRRTFGKRTEQVSWLFRARKSSPQLRSQKADIHTLQNHFPA